VRVGLDTQTVAGAHPGLCLFKPRFHPLPSDKSRLSSFLGSMCCPCAVRAAVEQLHRVSRDARREVCVAHGRRQVRVP